MTILMSFWPSIYEKIENQIKLIEYRRNFPTECSWAYMYVSKPIKAVCGIVYFNKKHSLFDWSEEYKNKPEVTTRISKYSQTYRYGVEISGFQKIQPITLDELRANVPNFVAPQSYFILENNPILKKYISENTIKIGERIDNNLTNIFPEHICKQY